MATSLKNLKNEIDCRLSAGGLSDLACCQLQNAQTILDNCIVTSVADAASLPNVLDNEGRFFYVQDINEYRFSNETWSDDVSSGICVYQNQLWAWGSTRCGALGDGNTIDVNLINSPVREFCSATDWCGVSAGIRHTSAVKTSGELWVWGCSCCGSLGDGFATSLRNSPVREICSATDWCQVSAGQSHTAAVKTSGQIWAWGLGSSGLLGDGTTVSKCSPVREFCSATDWCQVSASLGHTAAIKTSGQLWTWGSNSCGRLGDGTTNCKCSPVREFCSATDWCQVSGGTLHTAAVKTTGQLWAWGRNLCGRLGDGTTTDSLSPVREFCSATDWCGVSGGCFHSIAIKTSGEIWAWGGNCVGHLGDGTTETRCSPVREYCSATDWCQVSTGCKHSGAIKTSGQLWMWGYGSGLLGDGDSFLSCRCSPVREYCSATNWCQLSAGFNHTAAINSVSKGFCE